MTEHKFFSKLYLVIFLFLLLAIVTAVFIRYCDIATREEVERVTSPDSVVDAVVVRLNGGATTPFSYMVYIVPVGGEPKGGTEVFTADHLVDRRIEWKERGLLEIHYRNARIFHFTNFWQSKSVQNLGYVVEIRLIQH
jgi:hypothetical protein